MLVIDMIAAAARTAFIAVASKCCAASASTAAITYGFRAAMALARAAPQACRGVNAGALKTVPMFRRKSLA